MPLSGKERARLHREKVKKNPDAWQKLKEEDASRKKIKIMERTPEQKQTDQIRTNQRVRDFRSKQLAASKRAGITSTKPSGPALLRAYAAVYTTPSALGKAVARTKRSLPPSPRRSLAVVSQLALGSGMLGTNRMTRSPTGLPTFTKDLVSTFFTRDDISRQAPGRKEFVTLRKDGEKVSL